MDAFRSTLEEAKYSDLIFHVVDASNPQREKHMEVVYETLKQLGAVGSDVITVFNKMDLVEHDMVVKRSEGTDDGKNYQPGRRGSG